jgi:hypothetical protein
MKKLFLFFGFIFLISIKSQAQPINQLTAKADNSFISLKNMSEITALPEKSYLKTNTIPDKNEEFYFRRSKNYRIVGWSTLGAGLLLSGIGLIAANGDYAKNNANSNTAGVLTVAGAVSGVVSIPFMILASVYKHKAKAMVSNQKTGFGVPANVTKDITGITVIISIGR